MNKLSIYIVEDEPILATLLKYTLQSMGHVVCGVAESYEDAVKGLHQTDPDLVITDIMLRGSETGIDVARYIKANLNLPFIFLSSITNEEMVADAMSTAPVSYLRKPVSKEALNTALSLFTMLNITGKTID